MDKEEMLTMTKNWPEDLLVNNRIPYGWAGQQSIPNTTNFDDHWQQYLDIVKWINENIENPKQNACWTKIGDCIYVYIRKPTDWTWFILRWA